MVVIIALRCRPADQFDLSAIEPEALIGFAALRFLRAFIRQKNPCRAGLNQSGRDGAVRDVGEALRREHDGHVLFTKRLQPFSDACGERGVIKEEPGFIEDEQRRPPVEPRFQPVEEIGDDRRHRAFGVHQLFHFEADRIGECQAFLIGI